MCILIHHPKDACFSSEQLADFYHRNSDGFGAIVNHGDERGVQVYKAVGKLKDIEDLYYDKVACYEAIIHFRMKTHGDIDMENCHPYEVKEGLWMSHNGILSYGNNEDPKMSDTWHYIKDFIRPMLDQTPDALSNPYIRGYLGAHIGASNKFGFMDSEGNVYIINKHSGVVYDGIWYSNTYAWTPYKFGYGQAPANTHKYYSSGYDDDYRGNYYPTTSTSVANNNSRALATTPKKGHHYGSSKSWQLWNDMDDEIAAWEKDGYKSPSAQAEDKVDPVGSSAQQRKRVKQYKAKSQASSRKMKRAARTKTKEQVAAKTVSKPVYSGFVAPEVLARIIRSCYNAYQTDDYHGIVRWVSENPMKCASLLYELYGDDGPGSKWTSEIISDRVNTDPEWGADAVIDMWSENEEMLLEMGDITKPNSSKGEHSYV